MVLKKFSIHALLSMLLACASGCGNKDSGEQLAALQEEIAALGESHENSLNKIEKLEVLVADLRANAHLGAGSADDSELDDSLMEGAGTKTTAVAARLDKQEEKLSEGIGNLSETLSALSKSSQHNQKVLLRHIQALEEKVGIPKGQAINSGSLVSEGEKK
jgi:hypothetical protein